MTLDSREFKELLATFKTLREKDAFEEALQLLESHLPEMAKECLTKVYFEIIYTAEEAGNFEKCLTFTRKLVAIDPDNPAATRFLK